MKRRIYQKYNVGQDYVFLSDNFMLPRTNMRFVYLKRNLFVYLQYFQ